MFLHTPLNLSSCNDNKVFCHVIAGCADKLTLSCIRTYAYVRMYACTYVRTYICMYILIDNVLLYRCLADTLSV